MDDSPGAGALARRLFALLVFKYWLGTPFPGGWMVFRMDFFQTFTGDSVSLTLANFGYCFLGVLVGTLVGVFPAWGQRHDRLLLPLTFKQDPVRPSSCSRGSTTAPVRRVHHFHPGEPFRRGFIRCHPPCGYQMWPRQDTSPGRPWRIARLRLLPLPGLWLPSAWGSWLLPWPAWPSNRPPEYFSLVCLGLVAATFSDPGFHAEKIPDHDRFRSPFGDRGPGF